MEPITKDEFKEILKEELGGLEIRLEEKIDKKIIESENRLGFIMDNKVAESESRLDKKIDTWGNQLTEKMTEWREELIEKIIASETRLNERMDHQRIIITEEIRKTNQKVDLLAMTIQQQFDKVTNEE